MRIQGPPRRCGLNQCLERGPERAYLTLPLHSDEGGRWAQGSPIWLALSETTRVCPFEVVGLKGSLEKAQARGKGDEFRSGCIKSKVPVGVSRGRFCGAAGSMLQCTEEHLLPREDPESNAQSSGEPAAREKGEGMGERKTARRKEKSPALTGQMKGPGSARDRVPGPKRTQDRNQKARDGGAAARGARDTSQMSKLAGGAVGLSGPHLWQGPDVSPSGPRGWGRGLARSRGCVGRRLAGARRQHCHEAVWRPRDHSAPWRPAGPPPAAAMCPRPCQGWKVPACDGQGFRYSPREPLKGCHRDPGKIPCL